MCYYYLKYIIDYTTYFWSNTHFKIFVSLFYTHRKIKNADIYRYKNILYTIYIILPMTNSKLKLYIHRRKYIYGANY